MAKSKIVGMMALVAFAMGIVLVGDGLAGEKIKVRTANYRVKVETINVPGEEGHILMIYETKGISIVLQGPESFDGNTVWAGGVIDMNQKTGVGSLHGYTERTDRDGHKTLYSFEGKLGKVKASGTAVIVRGTGKYEGIKGKATWDSYAVAPNQNYTNWEHEVEWPR